MDEVYWQIGMTLAESEKRIILKCLRFCENNKTRAANMLGVSVKTIHNKLKEYGIETPDEPTPPPAPSKKK